LRLAIRLDVDYCADSVCQLLAVFLQEFGGRLNCFDTFSKRYVKAEGNNFLLQNSSFHRLSIFLCREFTFDLFALVGIQRIQFSFLLSGLAVPNALILLGIRFRCGFLVVRNDTLHRFGFH